MIIKDNGIGNYLRKANVLPLCIFHRLIIIRDRKVNTPTMFTNISRPLIMEIEYFHFSSLQKLDPPP